METIFNPTKKEPAFKLYVSNSDENITVNRHFATIDNATRFGVLLNPKNPLHFREMCNWLEGHNIPTNIQDCSEFGPRHPNGIFVYNRQVVRKGDEDYIYFVNVNYVPRNGSGINYPEVSIEGYKYDSSL